MITATATKALADALPDFQTGDLLLFEGNPKNPLDWAIQMEEGAPYTHSGMLIRLPDGVYFWDAPGGGNTFPDPYKNGAAHTGCRVAPIGPLLDYYMTSELACYYRQLSPAVTPAQVDAMTIFIQAADGLPFPMQNPPLPDELNLGIGLALSYGLGKKFQLTRCGSFYCAHLVAETYMRMGLMAISPNPANAYTPADFATNSLPLNGVTLGPVTQILPSNAPAGTYATPLGAMAVAG